MSQFADYGSSGVIQTQQNGTLQSTRPTLNFIPSTNISITVTDDPSGNRTDIAIAATGSGGGGIVGPSPVVDSTIPVYDGTTGGLVKDTGVVIDAYDFIYPVGVVIQNTLPAPALITIGPTQQMIVGPDYNIDGTLNLEGVLVSL